MVSWALPWTGAPCPQSSDQCENASFIDSLSLCGFPHPSLLLPRSYTPIQYLHISFDQYLSEWIRMVKIYKCHPMMHKESRQDFLKQKNPKRIQNLSCGRKSRFILCCSNQVKLGLQMKVTMRKTLTQCRVRKIFNDQGWPPCQCPSCQLSFQIHSAQDSQSLPLINSPLIKLSLA